MLCCNILGRQSINQSINFMVLLELAFNQITGSIYIILPEDLTGESLVLTSTDAKAV